MTGGKEISGEKEYDLTADVANIRLDKYLTGNYPELSRTSVQKLIADGQVKVNGRVAKASAKLSVGDDIKFTVPPPAPTTLEPEDIPLNILYEDDDLLVVDKPAGLIVHPSAGHSSHTLVNAVLFHFSELPDTGDWQRPGIVHRLDKDTSGVMVIAKNSRAHRTLTDQFKNRTVKKVYLVLVKGLLTPEEGVIEASIGRDRRHREKMAVVDEEKGRDARTEYCVVDYHGKYTLIEVMPETGRTHQIRVHLAAIGYPVAGDSAYGVKTPFLNRQFVHAHKIGFRLPSSDEFVEFTSELPADLDKALKDAG